MSNLNHVGDVTELLKKFVVFVAKKMCRVKCNIVIGKGAFIVIKSVVVMSGRMLRKKVCLLECSHFFVLLSSKSIIYIT